MRSTRRYSSKANWSQGNERKHRQAVVRGDLFDFGNSLGRGDTMEQVAEFLCRDVNELRAKLRELGLSPVHLRQR